MKATKIFMMAALALTFAACSNDDNDLAQQPAQQPANDEITITATVSSDDGATTRALSPDGDNIASTWETTDEFAILFNDGSSNVKRIATVVAPISGSSVTITFTIPSALANNTDCTIVYPASAANTANTGADVATALAAQDGTIENCPEVRVGTAIIDKDNHSLSSVTKLAAQNAIFKFTLGSAIDDTHPLYIKDNTGAVITTITPSASTTTAYVAMEPATAKYFKFSATTSENKIISKSNTATIVAGKYYQTTLAVPALGDLYYSDGTYSTTLQTGKTAIGVIAYLGTDNFTENGTTVGGSAFVGHGLVMCLKNAASDVAWCDASYSDLDGLEFGSAAMVTNVDGLKRTTNVSGYSNTKKIIENPAKSSASYPAASSAWNYTTLPAPTTGTTGWFLPTAQQWVKMQSGLGKLNEDNLTTGSWYDNDHPAANKWEDALSKAGSGNYDSMKSGSLYFWSSSESDGRHAWYLGVAANRPGSYSGFKWTEEHKNSSGENKRVRPVLAF